MSDQIRFEAQIKGHRAPYQWRLSYTRAGSRGKTWANRSGEAETFEEASFQAQEAAREAYEEWLHDNTVETVEVLVGPVDVEREEELLVAEPPRRPGLERAPQLGEASD